MTSKSRGKIAATNNAKTVRGLALSSVKSSRLRNFFIVITIVLSVSLLSVMALFYSGMDTEKARQAAEMQHVIYYNLDKEQIEKLAEDSRTEYVLGMKEGQSIEVDGKMIQPVAYDAEPAKDEGMHIETITPVKGRTPEKLDEVMLSDFHCKLLGLKGEPGEKVSFTFLDGITEEFTISGIYHADGSPQIMSIVLSQEYSEQGTQLKDVTYNGVVRIKNALNMKQSEFLDTIRTLASDCGITRKNVNENNFYLDTLAGGTRNSQQTMVIIGVGAGILFVSVLVIYSVFYLAVVGRIKQFGQLRTIGMTKRQIQRMVCYEGLMLCGIGIPIGLLIGGIVSYALKPGGWDWKNTLMIGASVVAADIITVLISIRKPAVIASSISPVEASKFSGVETKKKLRGRKNKGEKETSKTAGKRNKKEADSAARTASAHHNANERPAASKKLYRKITPVSLAAMNRSRNRKKAALTMVSLGVGGVLFMLAAFFVTATNLEEYSRQGPYQFGEFVIDMSYNVTETMEHGQTDIQMDNPLNDEFISQLETIDGVENVRADQAAEVRWEAHGESEQDMMVSFNREETEKLDTMLQAGKIDYDKMAEEDSILIQYNDSTKEIYGWGYNVGDKVKLTWYNGEKEVEKEFTVAGILDTSAYIDYSNHYGKFILPQDVLNKMMNGMNLNDQIVVKVDRTKEAQIEKELDAIIEANPSLTMGTLRQVEEESEYSFSIIFPVMVGLSLFIVAFSILNMMNTLITNILTRKHEFAMMQSVGMTTKQLSSMIQAEGLMLTAGNLIITLILGTAAGYLMIEFMRSIDVKYMHFNFPLLWFAGYAVFTAIVPAVVSNVMIRNFQKEALVDRLR